jgi:hypothetical protein
MRVPTMTIMREKQEKQKKQKTQKTQKTQFHPQYLPEMGGSE